MISVFTLAVPGVVGSRELFVWNGLVGETPIGACVIGEKFYSVPEDVTTYIVPVVLYGKYSGSRLVFKRHICAPIATDFVPRYSAITVWERTE